MKQHQTLSLSHCPSGGILLHGLPQKTISELRCCLAFRGMLHFVLTEAFQPYSMCNSQPNLLVLSELDIETMIGARYKAEEVNMLSDVCQVSKQAYVKLGNNDSCRKKRNITA